MSEKVYRVFKSTFYENGDKKQQFFTIKRKVKFLWWYRWVSLYRDYYDGRDEVRFGTEGEAVVAIKKHQMGQAIFNGWKDELVSELDFSKKSDGKIQN